MALTEWRGSSHEALDEVESIHARVTGGEAGGDLLTQQIDCAYAMLILAHFQAYCRNLHSEAGVALAACLRGQPLAPVLTDLLTRGRLLDRANPIDESVEA